MNTIIMTMIVALFAGLLVIADVTISVSTLTVDKSGSVAFLTVSGTSGCPAVSGANRSVDQSITSWECARVVVPNN